ncbi:MAG: hypothetical protein ACOZNI_28090 [Myxococcota bacterium]
MNRFWTMAGRQWPPAAPAHQLVASLGGSHVHLLQRSGVLEPVALRHYDTVPCSECRRDARVIFEPGGAVAVCTSANECPDEELGPVPARLVLRPDSFAARLATALELDGTPGQRGPVMALGRRQVGEELVAFDFCAGLRYRDALDVLRRLARGGPSVRVVLVPDARTLPADAPARIGSAQLVWAGLDEVLTVGERLSADLGPILARRTFRGAVYVRPFHGLDFSADGVLWHGRVVVPVTRGLAVQLLRVLAENPGEWMSRRELWRRLWHEEHTRDGDIPRGVNPERFDARLRITVAEARAALRGVGLEGALENQRGDVARGGYRLSLRPEQVRAAAA